HPIVERILLRQLKTQSRPARRSQIAAVKLGRRGGNTRDPSENHETEPAGDLAAVFRLEAGLEAVLVAAHLIASDAFQFTDAAVVADRDIPADIAPVHAECKDLAALGPAVVEIDVTVSPLVCAVRSEAIEGHRGCERAVPAADGIVRVVAGIELHDGSKAEAVHRPCESGEWSQFGWDGIAVDAELGMDILRAYSAVQVSAHPAESLAKEEAHRLFDLDRFSTGSRVRPEAEEVVKQLEVSQPAGRTPRVSIEMGDARQHGSPSAIIRRVTEEHAGRGRSFGMVIQLSECHSNQGDSEAELRVVIGNRRDGEGGS